MKNRSLLTLGLGLISLGLLGSAITQADNQQPIPAEKGPAEKGPGAKPPAEAISLCLNKANKSQCSFQGPQGLETGYCEYTPDQKYFACNPNRNGQPPEPLRDQLQETRQNKTVKPSGIKQYPSHLAPSPQ
jgi:hypothetical protein